MKGAIVSKKKEYRLRTALLIASWALAGQAAATELVYYPFNPSFGGSPLNGSVLLNSALATNKHTDPDIGSDQFGIEEKTPAEILNESIERNIVSRLSIAASSQIIDSNGNFIPGRLETTSFIINVVVSPTNPNDLTITTTDKISGASTIFHVSNPA
ncbi:curli assembly protein CsgF [Pollutimonas bauzanensis]|jgi:curli production assembly/transport component CsgF|uniref:curli assembly protein CsgF n=1 Tax=Pollutimonas bauzanensis TaxID=658167 RepID=UPI003341DFE5